MMLQPEDNRISKVGLLARSAEGHAAKGMQIKGNEDLWIEIQAHTFRNWVNEHLRPLGAVVNDLSTDLCDGTALLALVEALQKRSLRKIHKPHNQHQMFENVTRALDAIANDGVKLVNIGSEDIVNGNLKLILGLIWSLIVRYQIGRSKFPPKKLMLAWLRSVLPECQINNFTTDWNSGKNLSALIEYCRPGLLPSWRNLNTSDGENNCKVAMELAKKELGVPVVLEPEYLASPHLDELSGMTYVSYFMRENGPGYKATMNWVRNQLPERHISNFTTDWNDGKLLCELVRSYGGPTPGIDNLSTEPENWESNLSIGMKGGEKLGVTSLLRAKDMADPSVDHLGIMAYTAGFQWLPQKPPPGQRVTVSWETNTFRKGVPVTFIVDCQEDNCDTREITIQVKGPSGKVDCRLAPQSLNVTKGTFTATEIGIHEVVVKYQGEPVNGSPLKCRVLPVISRISYTGLEPCAVGSVVEVLVNPQDSSPSGAKQEFMEVVAISPSGNSKPCTVNKVEGGFAATFKPDEAGEWKVNVLYKGKDIQGSPFPCFVFDPNGVKLDTLEGALPGLPFAFICDSRGTGGLGDIDIDITHEGRSIPYNTEYIADGVKRILLPVLHAGKHRVHIYFNGSSIKGSPFSLRVGSSRSRRHKDGSSPTHGKTRSFDRDFGLGGGGDLSQGQSHQNTTTTNQYSSLKNNNSSSFDLSSSSNRLNKSSTTNKYSSLDLKELSDNVDAVHSRIKYGGYLSSNNNNTSNTFNDNTITSSTENISSASAMKNPNRNKSAVLSPSTSDNAHNVVNNSSSAKNNSSSSFLQSLNSTTASSTFNSTNMFSSSVNKMEDRRITSSSSMLSRNNNNSNMTTTNGNGILGGSSPHSFGDFVVDGDGLGVVLINSTATVSVTSEFGQASVDNINCEVQGPNGRVPIRVIDNGDNKQIIYVPTNIGEHLINIKVGDTPIEGSPFRASVFNPKAIKVTRMPNGVVGRPVEIEINGQGAGVGHLAILVDGGRVTSQVKALGDHRFRAVFLPHDSGVHSVDMTFNSIPVPGSPWKVNVMESGSGAVLMEPPSESSRNMDSSGEYIMIKGDPVRHVRFGKNASIEISAPGFSREAVDVTVLSPTRKALSYRLLEESSGTFVLEFKCNSEVGTHLVEVLVAGRRLSVAVKVYNSSLIRVLEVTPGVVGQTSQFKVDASQAGEGQLEISINDGELPNQVRVLGGGCCLVSFTPEQAKPHAIDIKFNSETVFSETIQVADTRQVAVSLAGLELIPLGVGVRFNIAVDASSSPQELAVSVKGPNGDVPVKVSGSVRSGFVAEFKAHNVGQHVINVNHNGSPAPNTPFLAKAYDAKRVYVSPIPRGALGRNIQFTVDASQAGEGNLEITISAKGRNVPTQVHPQGGARFAVSFIPLEPVDHTVTVTFNKEPVPGSPFIASVSADPGQVVVSGPSLAAAPIGKTAQFTLNNVHSSLDDIEVAVEGPGATPVPAQVLEKSKNVFGVEWTPRNVGEHRISVSVKGVAISGSPFATKVYDVSAIKVKDTDRGIVGKPVTFLVETVLAGPGNLEVTVNGGQVPTSAQAQGSHTYAISFTPKQATPHMIELRFNGEEIIGSPFTCEVVDASKVTITGDGLEKVPIGRRATFSIEPEGPLGQPEVKILGPTKKVVHSSIQVPSENKYLVEYVPTDVGDHTIEVIVAATVRPFLVKAYDASRVKVADITAGVRGKPVYFSIDASQSGAGNLEIIVSVGGRNVPNYVQAEGNAKFRVNFRPQEAAPHTLSVRFNGESVPGSPFTCRVTDTSQIAVTGAALKMAPVNQAANITVDPQGATGSCNVMVLCPSGTHLPINMAGNLPEKLQVSFTPLEVGPHSISISLDNEPVPGSPFNCNVYDVNKVRISGLEDGRVGEPITFTVDASQAGEGTLELVVTTGKQSLRAEVTARSRGLYDVTFVPQEPTIHFVNITFNDINVPRSPFECAVEESYSTINGSSGLELESISDSSLQQSNGIVSSGLDAVVAGTVAFIDLEKRGSDMPQIIIKGPPGDSGSIRAKIRTLPSGLLRAEFTPDRVGTYDISINEGSKAVALPQPLQAKVFDPLLVRLRDRNETAVLGQEFSFKVDITRSGLESNAEDAINVIVKTGIEDVQIQKRDLGNGIFLITFKPTVPVTHRVHVLCNGFNTKNSPFDLPVNDNGQHAKDNVATGSGLYLARCARSAGFTILTKGSSGRDFDVVVSGPGGVAVPVRCYQQRDGNLRAEFTPNHPGGHEIAVYHRSKQVKNSPFLCQVYDPQKVQIGTIPPSLTVGQSLVIPVNIADAGKAILECDLTGPEGLPHPLFPTMDERTKESTLRFVPKRPGKFKIMLTYAGESVPGCPILIQAEEAGAAKAEGPGLNFAHVGKVTVFQIHGPGLPGVPNVVVEGPDSVAKCDVKRVSGDRDGHFQASYTPIEVGVYDVRVCMAGADIPNSPFHPRVVDTSKLRVIGGWEAHCEDRVIQLSVGEERKIALNTVDAGPGNCEIKLQPIGEDSANVEDFCHVETTVPNRSKLVMTPKKPGQFKVSLKYGNFDVEGAPKKLVVHAVPLGEFDASPSPVVDQVGVIGDASKVICTGDGLRVGTVGKDIRSFIDTRRAGAGELTAQCTGPRKTAYCELYDHADGTFTLNIRPQEPGKHSLSIRYSGDHVPGSPFNLKVVGLPDAKKVKVYGPGIEHGVLATFQSRFICDTRGAGAGQLTVRVRGPKGAFRVEMQRESQKDRTILCQYHPVEPGDYRVEIKWSGEHVPGSPYTVMIFDTQEELQHFVQGGSPGPGNQSEFYGSTGYSMARMSWKGSQNVLI